ncbi:hypothetical protein HUE58_04110 [Candidatus Ruthia endofausta]|uniref:EF-hand domain-containing protein n=1 Tax=Candidatus Ruthia endofausta TaxID=2738852 RepID=A0A6N0HPJ9_9GAMM|nr:hypothetical protein [Candidatus Ruthia endofausta]QKQ24319.1 hypothetical protein HUE58_04110 [Candidatus Ruthia endofausta]
MKKQPLILTLTTTLLLTTSSYVFSDNSRAYDQDNHEHQSYNQHHTSYYANKNHKFERHNMNNTGKRITLDEFITLKKAKFSQMDTNGDGVLTQNEMRNHRRNQHQSMKGMF